MSAIKIKWGPCAECEKAGDHKPKPYTNVKLKLCPYHQGQRFKKAVQLYGKAKLSNWHEIKKQSDRPGPTARRQGDKEWYDERISALKSLPFCAECGVKLEHITRVNISHILSKGAFPEYRNHPLNWNGLCWTCHTRWETGDKENMKIFEPNQKTIAEIRAISK